MKKKVNHTSVAENAQERAVAVRFIATIAILAFLLAWGLVLNVNIGSVPIPASEVFGLVGRAIKAGISDLFTHANTLEAVVAESTQSRIIFSIRMPRMLLAAILGGALALSGFLLQTFFRNPIAGPFVLGISSGAKMIVGFVLIFATQYVSRITTGMTVGAAFAGSMLIVAVILLFSQKVQNMSMLLVIGIMIGYVCTAATDFFVTFAQEEDIVNLVSWSKGSFSGASWKNVGYSLTLCLFGFIASWLLSKPIGAYALGEGYARSLGINIKVFRMLLITLSSFLSACVTAFAGPISFVGIAVPHITRTMLKTSRPVLVIPVTYLCGAVFCIYCDLIARTAFAPTELAIGTVTSIFGAPIVIYMMLKRRASQNN